VDEQPSVTDVLGSTIREFRLKKKLSQQQLADLAGLERSFVNGIERGVHNPTAVTVVRIAIALRITPAELFKRFTKPTLDKLFIK
jgi:transcriptional regulator with XRE-family HTH domain